MAIGSEYMGEIPSARQINEEDIRYPPQQKYIYRGVVGWKDNNTHFDLGTDSNDGHTFVKVTLNEGIPQTETPQTGTAHGYQIIAHIMGPLYWVPPVGTPVVVAFPDGHIEAPGAGIILGSIGKSPGIQFKNDKPKLDFGPHQDLVIKARTITISDYENNYAQLGNDSIAFSLGSFKTGIKIWNNGINMYTDVGGKTCSLAMSNLDGSISLNTKGSKDAHVQIKGDTGSVFVFGEQSWLGCSINYLGKLPSTLTGAAYGVAGPVNTVSTSVFISPV